ncbi:hypothetical protein ACIPI2_03350 [Micrococcus luteus]|uniref:hypothetical protein n=1 Tax=Micrococcus luteus TaxID=1270 RepID=UPI0011A05F82|nr:hypothetical protein [Micrococcus luteus]
MLLNVDRETVDSNLNALLPSSPSGKWYEASYMLTRGSLVEAYVSLPGAVPGMTTACELEVDGVTLDRSELVAGSGNTAICSARLPAK